MVTIAAASALRPDKSSKPLSKNIIVPYWLVRSTSDKEKANMDQIDATKRVKKTKRKGRKKGKRKGVHNIIDANRIDPAVQVGLLELKVSEQNTKRLMKKAGIEY